MSLYRYLYLPSPFIYFSTKFPCIHSVQIVAFSCQSDLIHKFLSAAFLCCTSHSQRSASLDVSFIPWSNKSVFMIHPHRHLLLFYQSYPFSISSGSIIRHNKFHAFFFTLIQFPAISIIYPAFITDKTWLQHLPGVNFIPWLLCIIHTKLA